MEIEIGGIILEDELEIGGLELDTVKDYPELKDLEVIPSSIEQNFNHPNSYGYDNVKVKAVASDTLNITPTTQSQEYTGLYGTVNVDAVDNTIDNNIQASNIKDGVSILGVEGNVQELNGEEITVTATKQQQIITPSTGKNAITQVTVEALPKTPTEKAVNFYDYDGTLLYSYSKEEMLQLEKLPPLPTQEGLICQGWNWEYQEVIDYVTKYGICDVGATYSTDNGETRFKFVISSHGTYSPTLSCRVRKGSVTIDWGDGSEPDILTNETDSSIDMTATHLYPNICPAVYIITVSYAGTGEYWYLGSPFDSRYCQYITEINFGNDIANITYFSCMRWYSLTTVTLPLAFKTLSSTFRYTYSLKACIIPRGCTMASNIFQEATALKCVVLPPTVTSILTWHGANRALRNFLIPEGITTIIQYLASNNASLVRFIIPDTVTEIQLQAFRGCSSLYSLFVPSSVTQFKQNCFFGSGIYYLDLSSYSNPDNIPTAENTNFLTDTSEDMVIWVRNQAMLNAFSGATNWSTYASRFQIGGKYGS